MAALVEVGEVTGAHKRCDFILLIITLAGCVLDVQVFFFRPSCGRICCCAEGAEAPCEWVDSLQHFRDLLKFVFAKPVLDNALEALIAPGHIPARGADEVVGYTAACAHAVVGAPLYFTIGG